jgi:CDP-diacylglycerol--serine O-phosphatidyltransferase
LKRLATHIPNAITLLNLISGCVAVVLASQGGLALAALFVLAGAVFDFLDGMAARVLRVSSPIGEQLDSLADIITFGFAPAYLLYTHLGLMHTHPVLPHHQPGLSYLDFAGMYLPFVMVVFAALRLARFNVDASQKENFLGLPTPAAALLAASALYVYHQQEVFQQVSLLVQPRFWEALSVVLGVLMILPVRMFSLKFKHLRWRGNQFQYIFVGISLILLVSLQAVALPLIMVGYVVLSFVYHIFDIKSSRL